MKKINFFRQRRISLRLKKINKLSDGFTLIETLVAIAIFTMSIVVLMSVLASGISDTGYAKKKMIATYLAQEGIEYMRNMRDNYVLYATNGWSDFIADNIDECKMTQTTDSCYFSDIYPSISMAIACSGIKCHLYYDSATGAYSYYGTGTSTGYDSGFIREIKIDPNDSSGDFLNGGQEIKVTSTVRWTQGSGSYNISFSENLFNWTQ